jgi:hypothetical protein
MLKSEYPPMVDAVIDAVTEYREAPDDRCIVVNGTNYIIFRGTKTQCARWMEDRAKNYSRMYLYEPQLVCEHQVTHTSESQVEWQTLNEPVVTVPAPKPRRPRAKHR